MVAHIESAYRSGMLDALAGKDYNNPYEEEGLEASYENYDRAFEAYYKDAINDPA
jgi:hypothetical protein